ncbi:acetyltransferase domain-containing protein [Astrocystis sublimbata]|nr:acetyltransferase domain-containing protein [Astrocystis sublimbata]
MSSGANATHIPVRTTIPRLPLSQRPTIRTERLLLRALTQDDLEASWALRRDPQFMAESTLGTPDASIEESQVALDKLTEPEAEHFLFGLFLADTGELIGDAGIHTIRGSGIGWPTVGYKLAPAHWGRGYATECMSAVLKAWWELPREEVEATVHPYTLPLPQRQETGELEGQEDEEGKEGMPSAVRERVVADIAAYNTGSKRVLEKLGFEDFGYWDEPDTQLHRLGQPLMMGHYVLSSPS